MARGEKAEEFFIFRSALWRRHAAPDLHQQKHHADPQQDMSDSGHAGDRRIHAPGKRRRQYLCQAPHDKHHRGQVQPDMIGSQYPTGLCTSEGKVLFQQEQQ